MDVFQPRNSNTWTHFNPETRIHGRISASNLLEDLGLGEVVVVRYREHHLARREQPRLDSMDPVCAKNPDVWTFCLPVKQRGLVTCCLSALERYHRVGV